MKWNIVLAVIFGGIAFVGAMETIYQIYQLTITDAKMRGIKHPKLCALLASGGNNTSGLLLYMIGRRNYPVKTVDNKWRLLMEKKKKAASVGLVFIVVGSIGVVVCLSQLGI